MAGCKTSVRGGGVILHLNQKKDLLFFAELVIFELASFDDLPHGKSGWFWSVVEWGHKGSFLCLGLGGGIGFGDLVGEDIQRGSDGLFPPCSHTGDKLVDGLSEFCLGVSSTGCGLF